MLINNTFEKIYDSDLLVIVPKEDGSIGEGTTYENVFARFVGTAVTTFYGNQKITDY